MTASKDVSLTAMLGALSSVARVPFGAIPSLQPCTFIIACSGYVFGPVKGFAVGALTAILSGFFFGIGPWTVFQIIAWGFAGVLYAFFGKIMKRAAGKYSIITLAAIGLLYGYVFGLIMNLWYILAFGFPLTVKSVIAIQAMSFWMDSVHGIGNAAFFLIFGRRVIPILERFRKRLFN
jgi:energy-coupling factor transport system substrate-specific component